MHRLSTSSYASRGFEYFASIRDSLFGRRAEALRAYLASPGWGDCSGRGCAPRQFSDLAPQPLVPARVDCLRPKMRHCLEEASSARAADGSRGYLQCKIEIYLIHNLWDHLWLIDFIECSGYKLRTVRPHTPSSRASPLFAQSSMALLRDRRFGAIGGRPPFIPFACATWGGGAIFG
jgi:hypothetical protein